MAGYLLQAIERRQVGAHVLQAAERLIQLRGEFLGGEDSVLELLQAPDLRGWRISQRDRLRDRQRGFLAAQRLTLTPPGPCLLQLGLRAARVLGSRSKAESRQWDPPARQLHLAWTSSPTCKLLPRR